MRRFRCRLAGCILSALVIPNAAIPQVLCCADGFTPPSRLSPGPIVAGRAVVKPRSRSGGRERLVGHRGLPDTRYPYSPPAVSGTVPPHQVCFLGSLTSYCSTSSARLRRSWAIMRSITVGKRSAGRSTRRALPFWRPTFGPSQSRDRSRQQVLEAVMSCSALASGNRARSA